MRAMKLAFCTRARRVQAAKIGAMTVEVGLLVFVGSYVILLCTIRAVTRRRAAAQQAKRTLNSMRAEFEKSRIGEPTRHCETGERDGSSARLRTAWPRMVSNI